jgi:hypothetical protein
MCFVYMDVVALVSSCFMHNKTPREPLYRLLGILGLLVLRLWP